MTTTPIKYTLLALTKYRIGIACMNDEATRPLVLWNTWMGDTWEDMSVINDDCSDAVLFYNRRLASRVHNYTDGADRDYYRAQDGLEDIARKYAVSVDDLIQTCARLWKINNNY